MNVLVNLDKPIEKYRPKAKGGDRPSGAAISASEALENTIQDIISRSWKVNCQGIVETPFE